MTNESGRELAGLVSRDRNILRNCRTDGVLEMFQRVVHEINSRPPKDMLSYFERFLIEKDYIQVSRHTAFVFEERYGKRITFYRAFGIVMVLFKRQVACFVKVSDEVFRGDLRQNGKKSPRPEVIVSRGAFIPCSSSGNIFAAAYRSQLPSRGKETPDGRFSSRPNNK